MIDWIVAFVWIGAKRKWNTLIMTPGNHIISTIFTMIPTFIWIQTFIREHLSIELVTTNMPRNALTMNWRGNLVWWHNPKFDTVSQIKIISNRHTVCYANDSVISLLTILIDFFFRYTWCVFRNFVRFTRHFDHIVNELWFPFEKEQFATLMQSRTLQTKCRGRWT